MAERVKCGHGRVVPKLQGHTDDVTSLCLSHVAGVFGLNPARAVLGHAPLVTCSLPCKCLRSWGARDRLGPEGTPSRAFLYVHVLWRMPEPQPLWCVTVGGGGCRVLGWCRCVEGARVLSGAHVRCCVHPCALH